MRERQEYRQCCLPRDEQAATSPAQRWHDLDDRLATDVGQDAGRRFREAWDEVIDEYPADVEEAPEHKGILTRGPGEAAPEQPQDRRQGAGDETTLLRLLDRRAHPRPRRPHPARGRRQPAVAARLVALLEDMELTESNEPSGQRFDLDTIRAELGIPT